MVTLTLDPVGDRAELPGTVLVALTYTADLPLDHGSLVLFHLWTLAIEEQFYLIRPAVLVLAWRRIVECVPCRARAESHSETPRSAVTGR